MSLFRRREAPRPTPTARQSFGVMVRWDPAGQWVLSSRGGVDGRPAWTSECAPDELDRLLVEGIRADADVDGDALELAAWFSGSVAPQRQYRTLVEAGIAGARYFTVTPGNGLAVVGWRLLWSRTKDGRARHLGPGDMGEGFSTRVDPTDDPAMAAEAARWLNRQISGNPAADYRDGAFYPPVPGEAEPWAPLLKRDVPTWTQGLDDSADRSTPDRPALFGLMDPEPATSHWFLLLQWDPALVDVDDDRPAGYVGFARGAEGTVRIWWWGAEPDSAPRRVTVGGADQWSASDTKALGARLRELLRAWRVPPSWSLAEERS